MSRIIAIAVAATALLVAAVARHDQDSRARRATPRRADTPYRSSRGPTFDGAPIAGDPSAVTLGPRLDAEVRRMCRTMLRCELTGSELEAEVGACAVSVQAKMKPKVTWFATMKLSSEELVDELSAWNARCENTCPALPCYQPSAGGT